MGVSASIPYDLEEEIKLSDKLHWVLHHGRKKDEESRKDKVCVFKFDKTKGIPLTLGQRGVQRLRTIKHPNVLSFVESSETEDSLAMVTEFGVPLVKWLEHHPEPVNDAEKEALVLEVLWGLKNIIDACNFLHCNCKIAHCLLAPHSCFVTKNGDWKLGLLDLACDVSTDVSLFRQYETLLENEYRCPERIDGSWPSKYDSASATPASATAGGAVFRSGPPIDVYSIGKLIFYVFNNLPGGAIEIPSDLDNPLKRALATDPKRRPACGSLLRVASFNSDQLQLMRDIGELQLKPAVECLDMFKTLKEKIDVISTAACSFKILPSIGHSLKLAAGDFANRDARETCRQIVQITMDLLSAFAAQQKIEEAALASSCASSMAQLWTISDRSIRTALLKSLKSLREETLKSLVHVMDKLDENNLQEKLVRCITNLQQDPENSIRTNATIFLGKLMPKLKEATRSRIMYSAYVKAMKDPFTHCRVAGLRAAEASLSLMEEQSLCSRLLPQVCLLLVDKSPEVRDLAMAVMDASCVIMKASHLEKRKHVVVSASPSSGAHGGAVSLSHSQRGQEEGGSGSSVSTTSTSATAAAGWASWAVGGIAKSLEQATIQATTSEPTVAARQTEDSKQPTLSRPVAIVASGSTSGGKTVAANEWRTPVKTTPEPAGWSDDDDIAFDDDEMDTANDAYTSNMDSKVFDLGEDSGSPMISPPSSQRGKGASTGVGALKLSTSANSLNSTGSDDMTSATTSLAVAPRSSKKNGVSAASGAPVSGLGAAKKPPKAVVKKLAVTSDDADNWDDF